MASKAMWEVDPETRSKVRLVPADFHPGATPPAIN